MSSGQPVNEEKMEAKRGAAESVSSPEESAGVMANIQNKPCSAAPSPDGAGAGDEINPDEIAFADYCREAKPRIGTDDTKRLATAVATWSAACKYKAETIWAAEAECDDIRDERDNLQGIVNRQSATIAAQAREIASLKTVDRNAVNNFQKIWTALGLSFDRSIDEALAEVERLKGAK